MVVGLADAATGPVAYPMSSCLSFLFLSYVNLRPAIRSFFCHEGPAMGGGETRAVAQDCGQLSDMVPDVGTSSASSSTSAPPRTSHRYEAIKTLYRNRLSKVSLCKDDKGVKVIMKRYLLSQLTAHEQINVRDPMTFLP